jgi:hypothetical protein
LLKVAKGSEKPAAKFSGWKNKPTGEKKTEIRYGPLKDPILSFLLVGAGSSSETSVTISEAARCHSPQDVIRYLNYVQDVKAGLKYS